MPKERFREELDKLRRGEAIELETVVINNKRYPFKRLVQRKGVFLFEEIATISDGHVTYIVTKPERDEALNALRMYVARNKTKRTRGSKVTRAQKIMDYFQRAWEQLEAGRPISEEIVDGHTMGMVKVGDTFFLGIEERGKQPTQREVDSASAEQVVLAMMALRINREEKLGHKNSKGERQ